MAGRVLVEMNEASRRNSRRSVQASKDFSKEFEIDAEPRKETEKETDVHKITQRLKQIEFGKNTLGYQRYRKKVPRHKRQSGEPSTPDAYRVCSKRAFDGEVKKWRRLLHDWDPPVCEDDEEAEALPLADDLGRPSSPIACSERMEADVPMSGGKRRRPQRSSKGHSEEPDSPDQYIQPLKRPSKDKKADQPRQSDSWQHVSNDDGDAFGGWDEEEYIHV